MIPARLLPVIVVHKRHILHSARKQSIRQANHLPLCPPPFGGRLHYVRKQSYCQANQRACFLLQSRCPAPAQSVHGPLPSHHRRLYCFYHQLLLLLHCMAYGRIGTTWFLHIHQLQLHVTTSLSLTTTVTNTQLRGLPHHRGNQYVLSTLVCLVTSKWQPNLNGPGPLSTSKNTALVSSIPLPSRQSRNTRNYSMIPTSKISWYRHLARKSIPLHKANRVSPKLPTPSSSSPTMKFDISPATER
jgi:hypothetical protein